MGNTADFWIVNIQSNRRLLRAMENAWSSSLTQSQLGNSWQAVIVDRSTLPGIWTFASVKRKIRAQVNKKAGADGGNATLRGLVNPEFRLEGRIYLPSQFSAWIDFAKSLDFFGQPSQREQHTISHPMASLSGIRNFVALEIEYAAPTGGGPLTIVLGCLAVSERDGATKQPSAPPPPTAPPAISLKPGRTAPNLTDAIKPPPAAR